jgi:translation initiation factor IF-1
MRKSYSQSIRKQDFLQRNQMEDNEEKRVRLELEGTVIESNKGQFKVKVSEAMTVLATLSGKIRTNSVKILVGDRVTVEVSEYDTSRGRIVYRHKS